MANKKKKEILPNYDNVTIRTHSEHKLFLKHNMAEYMEDKKQCSSQTSVKCKSRNGLWSKKEYYTSTNEVFDGYLPVCKECSVELTSNSAGELSKKGLAKILVVLDIPFLQDVYEGALEARGKSMGVYIRSLQLNHKEKRFVDSDEGIGSLVMEADNGYDASDIILDDELYLKWGRHYDKEDIIALEYNYKGYINSYQVEGRVEEKLVQEVCYTELDLDKARAGGKSTKDLFKQWSETLGLLKLKPDQQNKDSKKHTRLGNIAELIEQGKPIVLKDPAFEDVDNMVWYITQFFSQIFSVFGKSKVDKKKPSKSGEQ